MIAFRLKCILISFFYRPIFIINFTSNVVFISNGLYLRVTGQPIKDLVWSNTFIKCLGLQREFRQSFENTGVPLHSSHWNYEGNKVVAKALTDKLRSIFYSKEQKSSK